MEEWHRHAGFYRAVPVMPHGKTPPRIQNDALREPLITEQASDAKFNAHRGMRSDWHLDDIRMMTPSLTIRLVVVMTVNIRLMQQQKSPQLQTSCMSTYRTDVVINPPS